MQLDCVDVKIWPIATPSARELKLLESLKFLLCTTKGNKLIHLCNEHLAQVSPINSIIHPRSVCIHCIIQNSAHCHQILLIPLGISYESMYRLIYTDTYMYVHI